MTATAKTLTVATVAALALTGTAHAGSYDKAETAKMQAPAQTMAASQDARITMIANQPFEVLGTLERDGQTLYRVPGPSGEVFLNHVPSDLTDVTTDVDVLDEFTFEYNGMTFTNRIVRDDADSVG